MTWTWCSASPTTSACSTLAKSSPTVLPTKSAQILMYRGRIWGPTDMTNDALLVVADVETFYGKSRILHGVSFTVPRGGITVLLGRNGAGKTTTVRSIMGLLPPRGGTVHFDGRDITGTPPHRI